MRVYMEHQAYTSHNHLHSSRPRWHWEVHARADVLQLGDIFWTKRPVLRSDEAT